MREYDLPFYQKSGLNRHMTFTLLGYTILFAATIYLIFIFMIEDHFIMGVVLTIITSIVCFVFMYIIIFAGILKVFYIEMTTEFIRVSLPFKAWTAYWKDISSVNFLKHDKNNETISITLSRQTTEKRKRTIFNNFFSLFGVTTYSHYISLDLFKNIDAGMLYYTIDNMVRWTPMEDWEKIEALTGNYEEPRNSIGKALISSFLVSIIIGIACGFIISMFMKAYVIVSLFGCVLVLAVFNRYYLKETANWLVRLLAGIICMIQVPITIFIQVSLVDGITLKSDQYINYFLHRPWESIIVIMILFMCFGFGIYFGGRKIK